MRMMRHERARRRRDLQQAKNQQELELSHQLDIFVANVIDDATKEEVESIFNEFILAEDALHAVAEQLKFSVSKLNQPFLNQQQVNVNVLIW